MFITIDVLGTILCITCILIAIYGVKKRIRSLFLFGICFFNFTPIIREAVVSAENNNLDHLEISLFFFIQVIIALPIRTEYSRENPAAMALSKKIGLSILVANLCVGGLILADKIDVPLQFGYLHWCIVLILLYVYVVFYKKRSAQWH
jgi:hypothetical protein